jgi:transposase
MLCTDPLSKPLFVGVDPHRKANLVRLVDGQGQDVGPPLPVRNNQPGVESLAAQLAALACQGGYDGVRLATEATGWYWLGLLHTLAQATPVPLQLYAFNPRLTANYKKALASEDHTDVHDALVIAERLRMGRDLPAPFTPDTVYQPLRLLTRYRFHLAQLLAREKNYALNLIYLKASEYTAPDQRPFSDPFGVTSRAVLTEFASCQDLLAQPLEELAAWLDQRGRGRFADPLATAQKLQAVARTSFVLPVEFQAPLNQCLAAALRLIASFQPLLRQLDAAIAEHVQGLPNTLATVPGLGPVLTGGLLAEIGDIQRFGGDDAKVARYAGLTWRRHQSADFQAEETPLTRNCNHYLRYYFVEAADSVRNNEPEYAAFYQKKYDEVTKHQHKRALALTARKLVRLVTRLLTTHQPYRPRRGSA